MKQFLNTTLLIFSLFIYPQEDLLSEIDNGNQDAAYEIAIFKGLKVINFESTKLVANKGFSFIVSHRFGTVKDGFQNLFGLDQAVTHLNFVYGISENVNISASRSSNQKIYELGSKIRLVKQRKGENPFNIVVYSSVLANTGLDKDNLPKIDFKHRLSYVAQLLVSRKINSKLSFILSPTFFHDNYISNDYQNNSQIQLFVYHHSR